MLIIAIVLSGCLRNDQSSNDYYNFIVEIEGNGSVTPNTGNYQHKKDTIVSLTAIPHQDWFFSHWEGNISAANNSETTAVISKNTTIKAVFLPVIKTAPKGLITHRPIRPLGTKDIEYIMIHAMSDAAVNPTNPFDIERIRFIFDSYNVDSHYVIGRQGQIYQFVADEYIAYHAGNGSYNGDPRLTNNMNRYAVGIELLGIGTAAEMAPIIGKANHLISPQDRGYTDKQYLSLQYLVKMLMQKYNIPKANVIGHHDYAPNRKWDPGELFDRQKLW